LYCELNVGRVSTRQCRTEVRPTLRRLTLYIKLQLKLTTSRQGFSPRFKFASRRKVYCELNVGQVSTRQCRTEVRPTLWRLTLEINT